MRHRIALAWLHSENGTQMGVNLSESFLGLVARRLHAISEPTRIRLVMSLEQREATVQELTDELSTTRPNISKHLAILYQSGIVARRRDGSKTWYSLADYSAWQLIEQATASVTGYVEELATITGLEESA